MTQIILDHARFKAMESSLRRMLKGWAPSRTNAAGDDEWSWWYDNGFDSPKNWPHEPMTLSESALMAEFEDDWH